jgi:hypothetical protein
MSTSFSPLVVSSLFLGAAIFSSLGFFATSIKFQSKLKFIFKPIRNFLSQDLESSYDEEKGANAGNKSRHQGDFKRPWWNLIGKRNNGELTKLIVASLIPLINLHALQFSLFFFFSLLSFNLPHRRLLPPFNGSEKVASCSFIIAAGVSSYNFLIILILIKTFIDLKKFSDRVRNRLITTNAIPSFHSIELIEFWSFWFFIISRFVLGIVMTALDGGIVRPFDNQGVCVIEFDVAVGAIMDAIDISGFLYLLIRFLILSIEKVKIEDQGGLGGGESEEDGKGWRKYVRQLIGSRNLWEIMGLGFLSVGGAPGWVGKTGFEGL